MAADLKEVEASLGSYEKQFADGSTELKKTAEPPVDPDVSEEPAGTTQPMAVLKEAKATADAVAINTTNATSSTEEKKKVSPKTTVTTDQEIILFPDDDRIRNGKSKEQSSNDNEATFNSTPTAKTKNTAETELTIDPQKKRTSDENEVVTHPDIDIKKTEHTDADDAKSTEAVSHNPVTETPAKKDSMDDQKETTDEDVAAVVVANDDSTMEKLTVKLPPAAEEVAKSICSVFPAAAATTTTDSVSTVAATGASNIPFVTLQPVFLNIKGSGDIAKALDSILQSFSPSTSFLDFDCLPSNEADSTSEEKIYLQRLKSLLDAANNKKDTHRKSSSVLLFLVLLIRIEVAVYMAFRDNNAKKATEAKIDAERKMHQSTLSYLLTQVDVMDNLSNTINPTTLKEVMAPLIEAGFCSFSADDVSFSATELKLSNLLFTPLSVLVQTISNLGESSDRPSFDSWDKAWKATVGNIRDFVDTAKKEGAAASNPVKDEGAKNNGNQDKSTMPENEANRSSETSAGEAVVQSNSSDWMDDNSPSVVTPIPASKKNKKKKSKRKVRNDCFRLLVCFEWCNFSNLLCWHS